MDLRKLDEEQQDMLLELLEALRQLGDYFSEQGEPPLLLSAQALERSARALQVLLGDD